MSVDQLNVAIVGLGHWGPNYCRAFERIAGVKVAVGVEPSFERRAVVRQKLPHLVLEERVDSVFADPSIDALVIATPTETHFDLTLGALRARKHVLVEKPITLASHDADLLIAAARSSDRILMVGHIFLFNEGIRELRRIIERNDIGRLLYCRSVRTNLGPLRSDVSVLWDLAPHDLSIFNFLMGQLPTQVSCLGFSPLAGKHHDIVQGALSYSGSVSATFFVSWLDPKKRREVTIVGDRKMLTFDDMTPHQPVTVHDKGVARSDSPTYVDNFADYHLSVRDGDTEILPVRTGEPLLIQCQEFVQSIREKRQPQSDGGNGKDVVRILEALSRSLYLNGVPVEI